MWVYISKHIYRTYNKNSYMHIHEECAPIENTHNDSETNLDQYIIMEKWAY